MKITYDNEAKIYCVTIEPLETTTLIHTDDIVEARQEYISRMTWMFNEAICKKLKGE